MCSLLPYGTGIGHCAYNVVFVFVIVSVHFCFVTPEEGVSAGGGWGVDPV